MLTNLNQKSAQFVVERAMQLLSETYAGKALSVAVCDNVGALLAFARSDGTKLMAIELTQRKAYTAARLGVTTEAFLKRLQQENLEITYFGDERFSALPGGIPVFNEEKKLIGAVGIGGISTLDDHLAAQRLAGELQSALSDNQLQ